MVEQSTKRQHFTDVRYVTVRWEPYKPDGARQMKAKGRWQEQVGSGDYFRWANCDRPEFAHDPETIEDLQAQLAAANARVDQARDAALVEAARSVNHDNLHGNGLEGFRKNRDRLRVTLENLDAALAAIKEPKT